MIMHSYMIRKVYDTSVYAFQDRFADGYFLPSIDESQDWFLVRGEEEDGHTILEFTRNLTSCDERDLDIQVPTL